MRTHLLPVCDFLAYCLMPNHFHFLIKTDERTIAQLAQSNREIAVTAFSRGLKTMLSSYAQAIQCQEQLAGSLFQQKTKRKQVSSTLMQEDYTLTCFQYILQNPLRANLVSHLEDWEFSSYLDLVGKRKGSLCNAALINKELALDRAKLQDIIGAPMKEEEVKKIGKRNGRQFYSFKP
jgi:REP element-mobilizing transposase RayT